jgi:hypothetical protein
MALSKIQSESMNLADTYAFTGTVSGTGLDLLATIDATPNASNYEWSMDYDDYDAFMLVIERISGSSTASAENLDIKFYMDGTLDNGSGTPYNIDNLNLGNGTHRNLNNTDNMEWMTSNQPSKIGTGLIHCVGFSNNFAQPTMVGTFSNNATNALASYVSTNHMEVSSKQVTKMRIAYTAGTVTHVKMKIYGVTE